MTEEFLNKIVKVKAISKETTISRMHKVSILMKPVTRIAWTIFATLKILLFQSLRILLTCKAVANLKKMTRVTQI